MMIVGFIIMALCVLPFILEDSITLSRKQQATLLFIGVMVFIIFTMVGWFPAMDS